MLCRTRMGWYCCSAFLLLIVLNASSVFASTIGFEDLPDAYFFSSGGQNIGTFYPGLNFGSDVTALSVSRFGGYDNAAFPPHSGDVVIWSACDPNVDISFSAVQSMVGIWYTSFDPLTLSAYDGGGNLLGSATGNPNTDGTTGATDFLSFSGSGIA